MCGSPRPPTGTRSGQALDRLPDDRPISARDPQRAVARSLSVEDAGEKALAPRRRRAPRPGQEVAHLVDGVNGRRSDGARPAADHGARDRWDAQRGEVFAGPAHCLEVRQREPHGPDGPPRPGVRARARMPVRADDPAQVAAAVIRVHERSRRECPGAHERIGARQARSARLPRRCARYVPPAALGQEAVIAAGHDLRPVLQRDAIRGLHRRPVREHLVSARSGDEGPGAACRRSRPRRAVRRSRRVRPSASSTGVSGARQYTQAWLQPRYGFTVHSNGSRAAGRNAVQGRLRADLVEAHVQRLGRVEAADDRGPHPRQPARIVLLDFL